MSSNDEIVPLEKNKSKVLQMLEEAGVSTESLVEESHPFWDTQVSVTTVCTSCSTISISIFKLIAYSFSYTRPFYYFNNLILMFVLFLKFTHNIYIYIYISYLIFI